MFHNLEFIFLMCKEKGGLCYSVTVLVWQQGRCKCWDWIGWLYLRISESGNGSKNPSFNKTSFCWLFSPGATDVVCVVKWRDCLFLSSSQLNRLKLICFEGWDEEARGWQTPELVQGNFLEFSLILQIQYNCCCYRTSLSVTLHLKFKMQLRSIIYRLQRVL